MKAAVLPLTWLACLLLSGRALGAEATQSVVFHYYECGDPRSQPPCVSPDETSKKRCCPDCKSWRILGVGGDLALDPTYHQPNDFLDATANQVFGKGLPEAPGGGPVAASDFYNNFQNHGWIEVTGSGSKTGSLMILPHTGGLVVHGDTEDNATIIYSSTKRAGQVRETKAKYLDPEGGAAKFVVPLSALQKHAATKEGDVHAADRPKVWP
jgi:hypothetical protein